MPVVGRSNRESLNQVFTVSLQDPVIFGGTIRSNLDPFDDHRDVELWNTLQQV